MPLPIRLATTFFGGILLLTAVFGVVVSLQAAGQPLWGMLSFEAVLLVTGLLALLLGLGRFAPGFGLGAAVLGATALGASVLGFVDGKSNLATTWAAGLVEPAAVLRALLALGLIAAGGADVLRRDTAQVRRFAIGVLVLSPLIAAAATAKAGMLDFLLTGSEGSAEPLRVGALFLLGVIAIVLVSAGGHLIITAFLNASAEPGAERT